MAVISDGQDLIQLRGNLATFLVGVTSRQNASWQGDVVWMGSRSGSIFAAIWNWSYLWMTQ